MARIRFPALLGSAALALLLSAHAQETATTVPVNQTTTNQTEAVPPAAPAPTAPTNQTTGNQTTTPTPTGRPSAMSQLEVRRS